MIRAVLVLTRSQQVEKWWLQNYGDDNDENHDDEDDVNAAGKCHSSKKFNQRVLRLSPDTSYSSMSRLVSFSVLTFTATVMNQIVYDGSK